MQATAPAAVLIGTLAFLATLFPTTATAQTSAAPPRQQEPTGLPEPDEATAVAHAPDQAELESWRTINVEVVVDENGRRVSTNRSFPVFLEGAGYATGVPTPMLDEDVDAPVVLAGPFGGTGFFVEALPGLPDRDERHLFGLMTERLHRGSYNDGIVAVAQGLEDRLRPPRPLPLLSEPSHRGPRREPAPGRTVSGAAVALFSGGTAAVILLLGYFLKGERYRGPQGPDKGVGFVAARREAEALLSALAPRVMLLAERETAVIGLPTNLGETTPNGQSRWRRSEVLLRQAVSGELWVSFVAATSLVEKNPEGALPRLRRLSAEVEAALGKLDEAEKAPCDRRAGEGPGGCKGRLTERDENDG